MDLDSGDSGFESKNPKGIEIKALESGEVR